MHYDSSASLWVDRDQWTKLAKINMRGSTVDPPGMGEGYRVSAQMHGREIEVIF